MLRPACIMAVCVLANLFTSPIQSHAAQTFPYQATVVGDHVEVRCGPGTSFYVTSELKRQETVTVHRHDHGGWYMISPPAGSVSWIEERLVNRVSADKGIIAIPPQSPTRAIVHIGSTLSDEHSYFGRELANGDEVRILGEQTLSGPKGVRHMLKIVPPAQEFRWVKGEFLVPLSQQVQQQIAADPYQVPAQHRERMLAQTDTPVLIPSSRQKKKLPIEETKQLATEQVYEIDQEYARLDELDRQYQEMMSLEPKSWKLDPLVEGYRALKATTTPRVAALVDQRLEIVKKRQEIANYYQQFVQVSAEASQRDHEILASRPGSENTLAQAMMQMQTPSAQNPTETAVHDSLPTLAPQPVSEPLLTSSLPEPNLAASPTVAESPQLSPNGLSGAGIIQEATDPHGVAHYVLLAPDNRILAYLKPEQNVDMSDWIGKPAGLKGERNHDAEKGTDVIRVSELVSVQLAK